MPSEVARALPAYREHPREEALTGAWQGREHGGMCRHAGRRGAWRGLCNFIPSRKP